MESTTDPSYVAASNLLLFFQSLIQAELSCDDSAFSVESLRRNDPEALDISTANGNSILADRYH